MVSANSLVGVYRFTGDAMIRTAVVTGAHGFMGRHMSRLLADGGCSVIGIGHGQWDVEQWKAWGLSAWHQGEINISTLRAYVKAPDAIFHFAGGSSVPKALENPLKDFERTVLATANLLEFVRSQSPGTKVIYPSSASVYGNTDRLPISEDMRPSPISPYGVHKWLAEEVVRSYAREYRIAVAIVRLFSVYGRGLRKQLLWDACHKIAGRNYVFAGTGDEIRDWLHIDDAAKLMLLATQKASLQCPIVNGGTGEGVCVRDVIEAIEKQLRNSGESPAFSGTRRAGDPTSFLADTNRAKSWGWIPTQPLNKGLSDYVSWWQQEAGILDSPSRIEAARGASVS